MTTAILQLDVAPFATRFRPAPVEGGFAMDDWWVWCGSAARGEDGRYHLFASRWPKAYTMFGGYPIRSEICRAVADRPEGPYCFVETVLPLAGDDPSRWDGRMAHNPAICRCGNRWLLFYIGATFEGPRPEPDEISRDLRHPLVARAWRNIRIGVATAPAIAGPWTTRPTPLLQPRPDHWDALNITNPAPCIRPDGSILLIYRSSNEQTGMHIGVAAAEHGDAPFRRLTDQPFTFGAGDCNLVLEDPFLWHAGERYEMLIKDCAGSLTGEQGAGAHAVSEDGLNWSFGSRPLAYSRTITWSDGSTQRLGSLERPSLLIEAGVPTCFFAAAADGPGGFQHASRTWNLAIPLHPQARTIHHATGKENHS